MISNPAMDRVAELLHDIVDEFERGGESHENARILAGKAAISIGCVVLGTGVHSGPSVAIKIADECLMKFDQITN